jgi:tetratricopeptide (TPR) repeat protein/transcriptional regulator with XRE-family HTH domain
VTGAGNGFGTLLRRERFAAGLTQDELAAAAGLSVRAVRDLERGASRPYQRTIGLLADALGLPTAARDELTRAARGAAGDGGGSGDGRVRRDPGLTRPTLGEPRQLPAAAVNFTGRSAELKTLAGLLDKGERPPGTVLITAIGGTAGVGKTALAVHWARQIAGRFPDGQLYVNLRGYDPGQPLAPEDALAGFLRALGVPGQEIPADTEERAARYRSLLAGRRMLMLLDNASSAEQVRPLLPAATDCVAIVTSRDTLAGLIVRDGAQRLSLDLLPAADAGMLLTALIGDRAAADPVATAALAATCARLPLALRIAAELAAARPGVPLAALVAELTGERRRLDLLEAGGDPRTAVRAVFSWSCRHLDPDTARTFRLVGLHPRPDLEAYAAAALTGTSLEHAQHLLDALARASLIHTTTSGHYSQHDLLRDYAGELAAEPGRTGEGQDALSRLFDHYLHTAAVAMNTLFPAERHRRPQVPAPATSIPPVTEPAGARAWLEDRRDALVEVVAYAAGHGWPRHATRLAATLCRYLDTGGHYAEAVTVHTWARRAAQQADDLAGEARALLNLADIDLRQGRYRQAAEYLRQGSEMLRESDNGGLLAQTLHSLGVIELQEGRYREAVQLHEQAVSLFREARDQAGELRSLGNIVLVAVHEGRYGQAAEHNQRALALSIETGDVTGEAYSRHNLALIEQRQGRYADATGHHQQALALFRQIGDISGEAYTLADLGDTYLGQEHHAAAVRHHRRALGLFRRTGNRPGEAAARNGLGEVRFAAGQPDRAHAEHSTALVLAREVGDKSEWARAHDGLGRACLTLGDPGRARQHWAEALTLYTDLGAPEAAGVATRLAQLEEAG